MGTPQGDSGADTELCSLEGLYILSGQGNTLGFPAGVEHVIGRGRSGFPSWIGHLHDMTLQKWLKINA